jgi:hypothetical protein
VVVVAMVLSRLRFLSLLCLGHEPFLNFFTIPETYANRILCSTVPYFSSNSFLGELRKGPSLNTLVYSYLHPYSYSYDYRPLT